MIDEMSIKSGVIFDTSTNTFVGHVSLPNHSGIATHGQVIMLAGIASRWKQIVAYGYTGNSVNGAILANIIKNVIIEAEKIGLIV